MKYLFLLVFLVGCGPEIKPVTLKDILSESQYEVYSKSSPEFRAYLDSCIRYSSYKSCFEDYMNLGIVKTENKDSKTTAGDIALGVAGGTIATKIIMGL